MVLLLALSFSRVIYLSTYILQNNSSFSHELGLNSNSKPWSGRFVARRTNLCISWREGMYLSFGCIVIEGRRKSAPMPCACTNCFVQCFCTFVKFENRLFSCATVTPPLWAFFLALFCCWALALTLLLDFFICGEANSWCLAAAAD